MRKAIVLPLIAFGLIGLGTGTYLLAQQAAASAAPVTASADVKMGLGVAKYEITDPSDTFKVAADTRIYAWTKVTGLADSKITVTFNKGDKVVSKQELTVTRSPHRTNAFRTFRKGDGGQWTAKVLGPDGTELGSATFTVEILP